MIDVHIHIEKGEYTLKWIDQFVNKAVEMGLYEIYLLEHSHRFIEFKPMYQQVRDYSKYQEEWFNRELTGKSIKDYTNLIDKVRKNSYPIKVKLGLEICYFEDSEKLINNIIKGYDFDFVTGSVHWVDGFGFDHKKELWNDIDVDYTYKRYYEIMQSLIKSELFNGVAHPDSIKCFGHYPSYDLTKTYQQLASLLNEYGMYAEQSGGLALNYNTSLLGMNKKMLSVFKQNGIKIMTASDAHHPDHVGANIVSLQQLLEDLI